MRCDACGAENEAGHKFCSECGAKLTATCPNCGAAVSPNHKFCPECGTGLHAATAETEGRSAPESPLTSERRLVSVLFADLVGFTPLSESRDPEEVRALLTTYFDRSREIVGRFGGAVDKFIGDAVMAVWGATSAKEDDAERSVRAALELVDMVTELGAEIEVTDLSLRVGVLTGETSVGPGGNEKGLVVGDLVNTASRLQSIAAPGSVVVGESTFRLVQESIEMEPLGEQTVKGKSAPVATWRVRRVLSQRGGKGRAGGLEPPFVGRDEELRLLKDLLGASGRESRARLISIIGEAGIGKSRLAWEFQKYADGLVEPIYWHQGRSPAYGEGLTFWALTDMIRARAGIAETDDPHKARTKLRTAVVELVQDADDQRWIEPRLAGLLGLEPMPPGERTELFAALRTFFHRIAERGTTVLIFEDLHWADSGLLEFVEELVERSRQHRLLVVTLARPDLLEREPGWGSGRRNFVSLHLAPLADTAMGELVRGIVPGIPPDAADRVIGRAAGIPLYAVELARMLIADGVLEPEGGHYRLVGDVSDLGVPESLRAVIGARIDRLAADDQWLLKDAAVLGQSFTLDALNSLRQESSGELEQLLRPLVRNELLEFDSDPRSPERSMYRFVQSLIREVAHGRLTREERRSRHLRVAEYFQASDEIELAALVASHYLDAYEATPDGPEAEALRARAIGALQGAAQRATDLHSDRQALALCEQALEITNDPIERADLWAQAAAAANGALLEEEAVSYAEQALEVYTEASDEDGVLRSATLLAVILNDTFRSDEALAVLEDVEGQEFSTSTEVMFGAQLARTLMLTQASDEAAATADRVLLSAERLELIPVVVDVLITRATALGNVGRMLESRVLLEGAIGLAESHDLPLAGLRAANNLGVTLEFDDPRSAMAVYQGALEVANRLGDPHFALRFALFVAGEHIAQGNFVEGFSLLDSIADEELTPMFQGWYDWNRAFVGMLKDTSDEAVETARSVVSILEDSTDPQTLGMTDWYRATTTALEGRFAEAFDEALGARDWGWFPYYLQLAAEMAMRLRDPKRLSLAAERVHAMERGGRMLNGLRRFVDAGLVALRGSTEEAVQAFDESLAIWSQVANAPDIAMAQSCMAALIGQDHPEGRAAAEAAYEWVTSVGADRYLTLWADGLPAGEVAATGA